MEDKSPEETANEVWKKLELYKKSPNYLGFTDSEILSSMVFSGTITLEDLNIAFDVRKSQKKSR